MTAYTLHPMQAAWLSLETDSTPMHLGALLYFQLPKSAKKDFVQKLATHMRQQAPNVAPWNRRLTHKASLLRGSRLETVTDVDIDYHFRHSALPAPGGEREMGELVSRLHSHPMDLSKPAWEIHLIEGLQNKRFALYLKLHPAVFDGASVLEVVRKAMSTDPDENIGAAIWAHFLPREVKTDSMLQDWPALLRTFTARLAKGFRHSVTWTGLKGVPRTALNDRINNQRRFATQQYEIARLEAVAKPLAVTVEELLCYLLSSSVRRFFKEFNALPDQPMVALLADRSRKDGSLNPLFFSLATHQADKRRRLDEIKRALKIARHQYAMLTPADARAEGTVDSLPYLLRQALGIDHQLAPMFNLGIAELSLGDESRYLDGARLESVFPMPMLLQGGALNVGFMRYAKTWSIGLLGARENLPHLQRMAVYMGKALEELEEALA